MRFDLSFRSLVGGISIGLDRSGTFAVSPSGLAVRDRNGRYKARVAQGPTTFTFIDVTEVSCSLDDPQSWVLRLPVPVEQVKIGDLVVLAEDPVRVMLVRHAPSVGQLVGITVDGEHLDFQPAPNLLLKRAIAVKVVSVFDQLGLSGGGPGGEASFLPLALMMGRGGSDCDPALALLLSSTLGQGSGQSGSQDPFNSNLLLFLALAGRDRSDTTTGRGGSDSDPALALLLASTLGQGSGQSGGQDPINQNLLLFLALAGRDRADGWLDGLLLALALRKPS